MSFDSTKYVSPILHGALGNNLFQIATIIAYAKQTELPFIVGYWSHFNSTRTDITPSPDCDRNPFFMPFCVPDALAEYGPDYTWPSMFPLLPYFDNPNCKDDGEFTASVETLRDEWDYEHGTGKQGNYVPIDIKAGEQLQGYFFNNKYWHNEREEILKYLTFGENFLKESCKDIQVALDSKETTSLNMRYVDNRIPCDVTDQDLIMEYVEDFAWIKKAIQCFSPDNVFVITSNDRVRAEIDLRNAFPTYNFIFVEGNPGQQMAACSACDNHIVINSTFSFWCAYLDPKLKGKVIYSTKFKNRHSPNCIPYDEWIELN